MKRNILEIIHEALDMKVQTWSLRLHLKWLNVSHSVTMKCLGVQSAYYDWRLSR